MSDVVIVFKDKKSREIKTYVNVDGHGAQASVADFIKLVAELYGSPAGTFTKKSLEAGLLAASELAIRQMKVATREVAAVASGGPKSAS